METRFTEKDKHFIDQNSTEACCSDWCSIETDVVECYLKEKSEIQGEMYAMLEAHIAAWDSLYPSDANDVDDINIGEFEVVHGFINKTKSLLAKARGESNE